MNLLNSHVLEETNSTPELRILNPFFNLNILNKNSSVFKSFFFP